MSDDILNNQAAPDAGQADGGQTDANSAAPPATFEEWLTGQNDDVRSLITGHIGKLQSALNDERAQRRTLAKQISDLSGRAEQGSQLRAQLEKLSSDFEEASRKTMFYESAPADVRNLRLAWLAANDAGLIDAQSGAVDFAELRRVAPELFLSRLPSANAGAGSRQTGVARPGMNDFLRAATGRNN